MTEGNNTGLVERYHAGDEEARDLLADYYGSLSDKLQKALKMLSTGREISVSSLDYQPLVELEFASIDDKDLICISPLGACVLDAGLQVVED